MPPDIELIDYLFPDSGLLSITIPATVKEITSSSFSNCNLLQNVTYLGTSEITSLLFVGCDNLKAVFVTYDYPSSRFGDRPVTRIGDPPSNGLSLGAKIGIGVGVALGVVVIAVVVVIVIWRLRKGGENQREEDPMVTA